MELIIIGFYMVIGIIYAVFTLIKNIKDASYSKTNKSYKNHFNIDVFLMDIFIWPLGLASDIYHKFFKDE